jgi:hypothetical protein
MPDITGRKIRFCGRKGTEAFVRKENFPACSHRDLLQIPIIALIAGGEV